MPIPNLDYLDICTRCKNGFKHIAYDGGYVCKLTKTRETLPEGVVLEEYEYTYYALPMFRDMNNGKCPHFKKCGKLTKLIRALLN